MTGLALLIALPAAAEDMFFYPSQGQSSERQNKDKGECHVWAVQQAARQQQYDMQIAQQRNNYNRALAACMQGRGYSAG